MCLVPFLDWAVNFLWANQRFRAERESPTAPRTQASSLRPGLYPPNPPSALGPHLLSQVSPGLLHVLQDLGRGLPSDHGYFVRVEPLQGKQDE